MHGVGWHLDLHSTIKTSRHAHFALMPACNRHYDDTWAPLLAEHGLTALVRQHAPSHTFSHFTCSQLGFESFALECGAVRGSMSDVPAVLHPLLLALLQEDPFGYPAAAQLQRYEVALDLIKRSEQFRFLVNEQSDNFVAFAQGTALAQDGDEVMTAPCDDCALLFANSKVPVGDRAGLLLKPM
jgi:succinylglutamate desuccinylase